MTRPTILDYIGRTQPAPVAAGSSVFVTAERDPSTARVGVNHRACVVDSGP